LIVVDASAILEVLLRTLSAATIEGLMFAPGQSLHAPHLLDVEIAQVVRRYEARGEIDDARGRQALSDLGDLPIHRYPHDLLIPRVWELRRNLSAYDAVYVALAEGLDAPLLTRDHKLADAVGRHSRARLMS
jgi:predicted nucleic acid-binding protein